MLDSAERICYNSGMSTTQTLQDIDYAPKYIPLSEIIKYAEKGLNAIEIGKIVGCSHQAIYARFKRNGINIHEFIDFRRNPDIYYEELQHRLYTSIDTDDIKQGKAHSRVVDIAILEDKKRAIRGQATHIVDYGTLSRDIAELERKLAQYEEKERNTIDISDAQDAGETPQDIVSEVPDNFLQKQESNDINELRDE